MKKTNKLTRDELDELAEILGAVDRGPSPSQLMGYFVGLATAPELVSPREWLDDVLGPTSGFASRATLERAVDLTMRLYNSVVVGLARDRMTYPNDLEERMAWCQGYMRAFHGDATWRAAIEADDALLSALVPISVGAGEIDLVGREDDNGEIIEDPTPQLIEATDAAPKAAWRTYLHFEAARRPPKTTKVGRNEPCPCGSGKKHKRCCLN